MKPNGDMIMLGHAYGRAVHRALIDLPGERRTRATHRAFTYALCCIQQDTGELLATPQQIAAEIEADLAEVERVLLNLVRLRVIVRDPRREGVGWFINPHLAWCGCLQARASFAALVPPPDVEPSQAEPLA